MLGHTNSYTNIEAFDINKFPIEWHDAIRTHLSRVRNSHACVTFDQPWTGIYCLGTFDTRTFSAGAKIVLDGFPSYLYSDGSFLFRHYGLNVRTGDLPFYYNTERGNINIEYHLNQQEHRYIGPIIKRIGQQNKTLWMIKGTQRRKKYASESQTAYANRGIMHLDAH